MVAVRDQWSLLAYAERFGKTYQVDPNSKRKSSGGPAEEKTGDRLLLGRRLEEESEAWTLGSQASLEGAPAGLAEESLSTRLLDRPFLLRKA